MRMIEGGFLDTATVEDLANKLGIGSRHLSRLFRKHLGASPSQVAATQRIHKAKRLLSDTSLPIAEIAFEAGFKSLRRFNDAFKAVYKRPPSKVRR